MAADHDGRDTEQPAARGVLWIEARGGARDLEECRLDEVIGVAGAYPQPADVAADRGLVPLEQLAERVEIAGGDRGEQLAVGRACGRSWRVHRHGSSSRPMSADNAQLGVKGSVPVPGPGVASSPPISVRKR